MEKIKQALNKAIEAHASITMGEHTIAHVLLGDVVNLLSELDGSKPKEHDASFDLLWIKLMDALKKRGIAPSNANELFVLIGDLRKSSNSHEVQPKEQGAEPVALAQEVMKVWNEDGDGGEIQKKTPIAWYRVTRLAEEILAGKCIPTSREKTMEEAGDAMHRVLYDELGSIEVGDVEIGRQQYTDEEAASAIMNAMALWDHAKQTK